MVWYGADDTCYACGKIDCGPNCPRVIENNARDPHYGRNGHPRGERRERRVVETTLRVFTLDGPLGAKLHIDETQAYKNDPGNGTPAIVEWRGKTGTYWCVSDTAEIGCDTRLPPAIRNWLASKDVEDAVESIRWTVE